MHPATSHRGAPGGRHGSTGSDLSIQMQNDEDVAKGLLRQRNDASAQSEERTSGTG
jgi:hypothetical protein